MFQGKLVQTQIYISFILIQTVNVWSCKYTSYNLLSHILLNALIPLIFIVNKKKHKVSHLPPVRCHTLGCGSLSSLCFPGLYGPINQNQKHFIQTIILKYTYFLYLIFSDEKFLHVMQIKKLW